MFIGDNVLYLIDKPYSYSYGKGSNLDEIMLNSDDFISNMYKCLKDKRKHMPE